MGKDPIIVKQEKRRAEVKEYRRKLKEILEEEFGLKESFMEENNLFVDMMHSFTRSGHAGAYINLYDTEYQVISYKCDNVKEFFTSSRFDHFIDFFVGTIRQLIPED